ncbi:MAG: LLM class F420-dependent oxidoreductase [Acidimicrobiales bacterium]
MKLSMSLNYSGDPKQLAKTAQDYERAGVDMVWVAELYSFDAVSLMGYLAAVTERMEIAAGILPLYSRTPTLIGMTAAGVDALSGGRCVLGLGASGPQVIEGWHGVPYDRPLGRTREIIDICRQVWRREKVEHNGVSYQIPLPADQGTGQGKALKIINRPVRPDIPIYVAALGPKNVALAAEKAEGWLPIFFHPDRANEVWWPDVEVGLAKRDEGLPPLEVVAGGTVSICSEDEAKRIRDASRGMTALYVGGMGSKETNFYNQLFCRYGYEEEAAKIQELYLSGKRGEAEALIPDDYLRATTLAGDEGFVRERIEAYRQAGVTRLSITPVGENPLEIIEKVKAWAE